MSRMYRRCCRRGAVIIAGELDQIFLCDECVPRSCQPRLELLPDRVACAACLGQGSDHTIRSYDPREVRAALNRQYGHLLRLLQLLESYERSATNGPFERQYPPDMS